MVREVAEGGFSSVFLVKDSNTQQVGTTHTHTEKEKHT